MSGVKHTPKSLLGHFAPPEGFAGMFGWVCGFSADVRFLNEATDRFMGQSVYQRMRAGEIRLALMLDPGQPALLPTAVPGLTHLPLRNAAKRPFRLLHAKVALLGFRHEQNASRWCVRLVVSTGNWTQQTVEDSLDLACEVQVFSEQLGPNCAQECADIKAATNLFYALRDLHDTRLLDTGIPLSGGDASLALAAWLQACGKSRNNPDKLSPRFIDSRRQPLFNQILGLAQIRGPNSYVAMGSGFYEGQPGGTETCATTRPAVPVAVVNRLKSANLLKRNGQVELYVNPSACQSIAGSVAYLLEQTGHAIAVHAAVPPKALYGENSRRTLHAKFLFAARLNERTKACINAWLYLGSGNFTPAGMMQRMSRRGGNLEAGVVLFLDDLYWSGRRKDQAMIRDRLPIGGPQLDANAPALSPGEAWQPPEAENFSGPLALLHWRVEGILAVGPDVERLQTLPEDIEVLDESGVACLRIPEGYAWTGSPPRMVRQRWSDAGTIREAWVPVIDEYGRVSATPLEGIELVDAEQQLLAFPTIPEPEMEEFEVDEDAADIGPGNSSKRKRTIRRVVSQGTAIRQMMGLLERIASRQIEISTLDWPRWCVRLEQTLCQTHDSAAVAQFVAMGLNPLSPLRAAPFRPQFAEDPASDAGAIYEAALDRVERAWKTQGLTALDGGA